MKRYLNLAGNSGVVAYEIDDDAITIEFADGGVYLYNSTAPGPEDVEQMQELAEQGRGLATYINRFVRDNYALKKK